MIRSRHRKGHGIHPPFAFDIVSKVIYDGDRMGQPEAAVNYRSRMRRSKKTVDLSGHGAGSRITKSCVRRISSIARSSSVTHKQGMFLYRLTKWYQPAHILELGTGIGISTAYMASGSATAEIVSVEGDPGKSKQASEELNIAGIRNVKLQNAAFESCLPELIDSLPGRSIVFIDGDHRYEPTVNTVQSILDRGLDEMIIVLDDIYWSDDMQKAWRFLCGDQRINISVDLFYMGILVLRPGLIKQHYNVTF